MPSVPVNGAFWPHPERLPLGDGYAGHCTAPGHEGTVPPEDTLRDGCNLGYARCYALPADRGCDAVRLGVGRDHGAVLSIYYVFESGHAPAGHGVLEFDSAGNCWRSTHEDARIQRMAECCLASYLRRRQMS